MTRNSYGMYSGFFLYVLVENTCQYQTVKDCLAQNLSLYPELQDTPCHDNLTCVSLLTLVFCSKILAVPFCLGAALSHSSEVIPFVHLSTNNASQLENEKQLP